MPHAETRAESLWWYTCQLVEAWADNQPTGDTEQVIQAYIKQGAVIDVAEDSHLPNKRFQPDKSNR
jgi:hypothetical protein